MSDGGPCEVTTRLEIEQWPRTWFGEEKVLLHSGDGAQLRRATGNDEGLPCPKTIRLRRLESNKQALWADQTRTKCNAFLGKIKLRTKTVHPRIGKLATPKEREKAKGKGSPYHREIPWP